MIRWWQDLSFRFKLPLLLIGASLLMAGALSLVVAHYSFTHVRHELARQGLELGTIMAPALASAIKHDDVWLAYTTLRGDHAHENPAEFELLDKNGTVFASSRPRNHPLAYPLAATLQGDPSSAASVRGRTDFTEPSPGRLLLRVAVVSDQGKLGNLLILYRKDLLWRRFWDSLYSSLPAMAIVLLLVSALGWIVGRRMVRPLVELNHAMSLAMDDPLEELSVATMPPYDDEVGRLARRFVELVERLKEKVRLERQMIVTDRLAAAGRVAAGVAHEINNPLGGLMVSLNTMKKLGAVDDDARRTLDLLERGLRQIQETVSALLVEVKPGSHPLVEEDIEDIHRLVAGAARDGKVRIEWHNTISGRLPLPSTLVRQVAMNLMLNAIHASPRGGRLVVHCRCEAGVLLLEVANNGAPIPQETLEHLFEPYYSTRAEGTGLGLWISYQIVQQLDGTIEVSSDEGETRFSVSLPLEEP